MNAKRTRTMEELEEALSEQVQFLTSSAESFDSGFEGEAKRLAVTSMCFCLIFRSFYIDTLS